MIFALLLLLSACAACHTCENPAFERITSTTIIENKEVGFSGLLVILENSVRDLAEFQLSPTRVNFCAASSKTFPGHEEGAA